MISGLKYWPVIILDSGNYTQVVHAVCFTDYSQSGPSYELSIRDSDRDPDDWDSLTIEYPSQNPTRLCEANTKKIRCLYFAIQ